MHHLAVGALAFSQKLQNLFCECLVAVAVDGIERPEGVAAKVPTEARTGGIKRWIPTRHQTCFVASAYLRLIDSNLSPLHRCVEVRVGCMDGQTGVEEMVIVSASLAVNLGQRLCGRDQSAFHGGDRSGRVSFVGSTDLRDYGKEVMLVPGGIKAELELQRQGLWALLVGRKWAGGCIGHSHHTEDCRVVR